MLHLHFGGCGLAEDLAGLKVRHGLDRVMEGGAIVLTLKDTNVLADGDVNDGEYIRGCDGSILCNRRLFVFQLLLFLFLFYFILFFNFSV